MKAMMKAIAVIAMLLVPAGAFAQSGTFPSGVTWALSANGELRISGNGPMPASMAPATGNQPWNSVKDRITSVIIEDGVTTIGNGAFAQCTMLASASIGRAITEIPNGCFTESGLTSIAIPEGITKIDTMAFFRCTKLATVNWNAENVSDFSLGHYPFTECNALRTVIFGNNVMTIPMHVFTSQTSLTTVTIGNSVTTIGRYAFRGCTNITAIDIPDSVQVIRTNAFEDCRGITSIKLGSGLSRIETQAFKGTNITELTIPEGVAALIGGEIFANSPRLRTVYFNAVSCNDVTGSDRIFNGCPLLETFVFGDTVRRIPGYMFQGLSSLISITIGSRVNEIGRYAFAGCKNMEEIINKANRPQSLHFTIFENVDKSFCVLRVPSASLNAYRAAAEWKDFQIEAF